MGDVVTSAGPGDVVDALQQMVLAAAQQAADAPGALEEVLTKALTDAGNSITALKDDALSQLKQAVDPPKWDTLLVFVLLEVQKLDPTHLSVVAHPPADGMAKAIALVYTSDAGVTLSVGLALVGDGGHGIVVTSDGVLAPKFNSGGIDIAVNVTAAGTWQVPFAGGVKAPVDANLAVTFSYDPKFAVGEQTGLSLSIGPVWVSGELHTAAPMWKVQAGFGVAGHPGLDINPDLGGALGLPKGGPLQFDLGRKSFTPKVGAAAGAAPFFDLGEGS